MVNNIVIVAGVVINDTHLHIISGVNKWFLNEDHKRFKSLLDDFIKLYPFAEKIESKEC